MALAAGLKTKLEILAALISSPALTATPLNNNDPFDGKVSIVTWSRLSPSESEKLNSLDAKVWSVSSLVVTELFTAVGALFDNKIVEGSCVAVAVKLPSLTVTV